MLARYRYRRAGGKAAIPDAVLNQAIARVTCAVAQAVDHLRGPERIAAAIVATLQAVRTDPVSAELLAGSATACTVDSALISRFTSTVASVTGIAADDVAACALVSRVSLALLCWPIVDRDDETAVIHRFVTTAAWS